MLTRLSHPITQFIIAALAYYLAGQFGRLLAIPPGFASAVWPASGIALALTLKFRMLPALAGTALGSLILNIGIASNNFQSDVLAALMPSAFISSGAFLQALVGRVLFTRFCLNHTVLDSPKEVIIFTLVVGIFSCFVSSSIGTSSLMLHGIVDAQNYFFTWATWWIGDTIGVLLFTPLLLLLLEEDPKLRKRKIFVTIPIAAIFFLVLFMFFGSLEKQKHSVQIVLDSVAHEKSQNLKATFRQIQVHLQSFLAFYQSSSFVTDEEFKNYATLQLKSSQVLNKVKWIPLKQSENFNSQWQSDKLDFENVYHYSNDAESYSDNEALLLNSQLKKKLGESFNFNHTTLLFETNENNDIRSVIFSLPIKNPNTIDNEKNQSGIILGLLTTDELRQHLQLDRSGNRALNLYFELQNGNEYIWTADVRNNETVSDQRSNLITFNFNNAVVSLNTSTDKTLDILAKNWESWYILTGGLLVTAFLQIFILLVTGYAQSVSRQVEQQTQAYLEAKDQAEKANEVKSQFLANMNHEVRTPLNAIIGFLRILHKTNLNTKQLQLVERTSLASHTLLDLVTQTLDYAKLETGRVSVKNTRFELLELTEKLYAVFIGEAESKGLEFKVNLPEQSPGSFIGDAQKIEQMLLHLLSNAVKFTNQGSVTFTTTFNVTHQNQSVLTFLIQDTGIGIEEEKIPHLFQPFNQADNTSTRVHGGTGLGLTICHELVKLMQGDIQCRSTLGQGSNFKVTLPIQFDTDSKEINADELFRKKHS